MGVSRRLWGLAVFAGFAIVWSLAWTWGSGVDEGPSGNLTVEELMSLPYVSWVPAEWNASGAGVVHYDANRSCPGYNLYNSRPRPEALLVDMQGREVRRWSLNDTIGFQLVVPADGGGLYALQNDKGIMRLDAGSRVLWSRKGFYHHEIEPGFEGEVYTFYNRVRWINTSFGPLPILDNELTVLASNGSDIGNISIYSLAGEWMDVNRTKAIYDSMKNKRYQNYQKADSPFDVFHSNSIDVLDRDMPGFGRRGNLLVSVRELDTLVVVDLQSRSIVWSWGKGVLDRQHDARLLPNGNILVFDNGASRGYSRVLEVEPKTGAIAWNYTANPPTAFYSKVGGSSQRLPNGNTLITNYDRGKTFEVTSNGSVVWEFHNPDMEKDRVAAIYRMRRLTPTEAEYYSMAP